MIVIVSTISALSLNYSVKEVKTAYKALPNYKYCIQYNFENITAASYINSTNTTTKEINCYCRYQGKDTVEGDGNGNTILAGLKSLCNSWLKDHDKIYIALTYTTIVMLCVNLMVTYGINLSFSKIFINFRYNTANSVIISVTVFIVNSWFLGVYPTLVFGQSEYSMPREWYLKAGVLHMLYYFGILVLYPLEILCIFVGKKIFRNFQKRKAVLQKEINYAMQGEELDYAHKIGRLLSHAFIAFLLSPGLPLLPLMLMVHLLTYYVLEKYLILNFYRKMVPITLYLRQYTIQIF